MERESGGTGAERGRSEVHTEVSLHPSEGERMTGRLEGYDTGPEVEQPGGGIADRAREMKARAAEAGDQMRDRAAEMKSSARDRLDGAREEVRSRAAGIQEHATRVADRSGMRRAVDAYPLGLLGVAFGAGFLIAGPSREPRGAAGRARQQIRGAVMAAATAAVAAQARSLLGLESGQGGGLGNLIDSLMGGEDARGRANMSRGRSSAGRRPQV